VARGIGIVVGSILAFAFLFVPAVVLLVVLIVIAAGGEPLAWAGVAVMAAVLVAIPVAGRRIYLRARRVEATHLQLEVSETELARGGEVRARLRVTEPGAASDRLEVGLVCTAFYDHEVRTREDGRTRTRREIAEEHAYKEWKPADPRSTLDQSFTFTIPPAAPFSYEGQIVAFAWRVSAREPAKLRRDPSRDVPLWVAP